MSASLSAREAATRASIVRIARSWLGTPYVHQASTRGAGADCLGLVRGVFRELYGFEPEVPPPYTPDWNEAHQADEPLLTAARRHLNASDAAMLLPGQVLVFRIMKNGPAKHCGIVSHEDQFIHAYAGRMVIESWFNRWWHDRLVAAFDYPFLDQPRRTTAQRERYDQTVNDHARLIAGTVSKKEL